MYIEQKSQKQYFSKKENIYPRLDLNCLKTFQLNRPKCLGEKVEKL